MPSISPSEHGRAPELFNFIWSASSHYDCRTPGKTSRQAEYDHSAVLPRWSRTGNFPTRDKYRNRAMLQRNASISLYVADGG
jgi:hypothetical protein